LPVRGGAGLASFGAVFCLLLRYVRVKRIPGDCGCIRWRPVPETATWRALIRSGLLFTAGIVDVMVPAYTAGAPDRTWFGGGLLAGGTVLLLSMRMPVRTPICRRPLLRRMRVTLRLLAGHEMFAAMAASAGPFGPVARLRRPLRARGPPPADRMHRRVLVSGGDRARLGGAVPGEPRGAQRRACRPCVAARRTDAPDHVARPGRQRTEYAG